MAIVMVKKRPTFKNDNQLKFSIFYCVYRLLVTNGDNLYSRMCIKLL